MFESELSDISSELVRSVLCKTIENQLQSENYKMHVKSASQAGVNNFVGLVYRVYYEEEDEYDNEHSISSSLILKVAPRNAARRAQFPPRMSFLKEIYMYDVLFPYFRTFEKSKGFEENGFIEFPKCYRTLDVEPDECLLLEDLSVRGFKAIDRNKEELTFHHVQLYLRALAKYHAISLTLKDQRPNKFQEIASNLKEVNFCRENSLMRQIFAHQSKCIFNALDAKNDAHLVKKLEKLFEKEAIDVVADCIEQESTETATVISYGDAQQNNLLFKYDKKQKPIEVILLDWQTSRVASPITDIVYFMFICTSKKLRDTHYESLLNEYHDNLSTHIRRLGSNPEKIFPYKMMQEHLHKYAKFGLVMASLVLPIFTADFETLVGIEETRNATEIIDATENSSSTFEQGAKFDKRMRDVVIDMARLQYF